MLAAGLASGVHCVGMCGGIVGAVSLSLPGQRPNPRYLFAYNAGRISSYTIAGIVAGLLGASGFFLHGVLPVEKALYLLANLMLVALGLYLAGVWQGVLVLEKVGGLLWSRLQPLSKKLLPLRSVPQAFALGIVWGWLPCGLVYSVLTMTLLSGSAGRGAAIMLAFGLGTLPNLMLAGLLLVRFRSFVQGRALRLASGVIVLAFGLWGLFNAAALGGKLWRGVVCHV